MGGLRCAGEELWAALGGSGLLFLQKIFFFFFLLQELLNTTRFAQFSDIILKLY